MKSKQLYEKATKASGLERDIETINEQILQLIQLSKPNELHVLRSCVIGNTSGFSFSITFEEIRFVLERRKAQNEKILSEL